MLMVYLWSKGKSPFQKTHIEEGAKWFLPVCLFVFLIHPAPFVFQISYLEQAKPAIRVLCDAPVLLGQIRRVGYAVSPFFIMLTSGAGLQIWTWSYI